MSTHTNTKENTMNITAEQLDAINRLRESQNAFYAGWLAGINGKPLDETQACEQYVNGHRAGRIEGRR